MRPADVVRARLAVVILVLLPTIVKLPLLTGWLIGDSAVLYGGLLVRAAYLSPGHVATIDPNIGYTSHALGGYAARALFEGGSPWWNALEGIGQPLAGEMQSAALFPPTLLLLLPKGQLIEHLLFQVVAGLATFVLMRRLRIGIAGAFSAAVLFEFNGVFAWLANAVINPICFLPVTLLGVEEVRLNRRTSGSPLVAGGLAASIYAGFPEVAYLNALLIACWSICRIVTSSGSARLRFTADLAASAAAGVLLAAPLLISFADFLQVANVGTHGTALADMHLDKTWGVSIIFPYFFGNLFGAEADFWRNVGGYAGCSLTALALAGGLGRSERLLRRMLAAWVAVAVAVSFGAQPFLFLFQLLPMTRQAALYRYLDASWLFAACVLAGFAVDDLRRGVRALRTGVVLTVGLAGGLVAIALASGGRPASSVTTLGSFALEGATLLAFAVASARLRLRPSLRTAVVVTAAAGEVLALFAAPIGANPYQVTTDLRGVAFLRTHLGSQRFATLGPLAANYGAFYGLAEVNHNDLPVPRVWTDYARRHLDPRIDPIILGPVSADRMLARLSAWAAIGTRYLVTPVNEPLPGLTEVHVDRVMRVYEVPGVRPYLSAPGCAVRSRSRNGATVTCARPTLLTRLEAFMPGWRASADGRDLAIRPVNGAFQSVTVPAGTSTIRFSFAPPWIELGYALAAAGAALLAALALWPRRQPASAGAVLVGA